MFDKFKTTVQRLVDLPWSDFRNLFTWPSGGSTLEANNPNLLVVKATNQNGEAVVYVTAEPILLVNSYVFNPQGTPSDSEQAGNSIDSALAKKVGVQKMFVVIPDGAPPIKGERVFRFCERKITPVVTTQQRIETPSPSAYVN